MRDLEKFLIGGLITVGVPENWTICVTALGLAFRATGLVICRADTALCLANARNFKVCAALLDKTLCRNLFGIFTALV